MSHAGKVARPVIDNKEREGGREGKEMKGYRTLLFVAR